jgi:transposase InsO family protein
MGPITPIGYRWERFFSVATDDFSRYLSAVALAQKADTFRALTQIITTYERQLQPLKLRALFTDRGGEFVNTALSTWLRDHGILHPTSPAYTPESNTKAERQNGVRSETARALMLATSIPANLWPEVAMHGAAYLLNRRPRCINKT